MKAEQLQLYLFRIQKNVKWFIDTLMTLCRKQEMEGKKKTSMNSTRQMQEAACKKKGRAQISEVEILKQDKIKIGTLRNAFFFFFNSERYFQSEN